MRGQREACMDQPTTKARKLVNDRTTAWPNVEPVFELPRQRYVYAPPRPLPSACVHETLDMTPVRLAPEIDPRQAATILSLRPVPLRLLRDAPPATSWVGTACGVLLLVALAVLPGTLVWLLRTHRVSESIGAVTAWTPRPELPASQPTVKSRPAGPAASVGGPRVDSLRVRPAASTEPSSRPPMVRLGTSAFELEHARQR
jgi:hypothetical protein